MFIHTVVYKISKYFSRKNLYSWLDEELTKLKGNSDLHVLNVGSGGDIEEKISGLKNSTIISIDIDENRNPDIVGDICSYKFEQKFDVIFMMEVLEHVKEPQTAIENIHNHLRPQGRLIMSTPFLLPIHDAPHDYYRYTKFGLTYLLESFTSVTIQSRNSWLEAWYVILARLLFSQHKSDRILGAGCILLSIPFIPVIVGVGKLIKSDFSTTGYFTVANK